MIYLISNQRTLFGSTKYTIISVKKALEILNPLKKVQIDTETIGLDCHTKALLTLQLGNKNNQVVFDWFSLTKEDKQLIKEYLESDRLFIGQNLMFDLTFMYKQDIWIKHIYDTMIGEQLIYLGYPKVLTPELYEEVQIPEYEFIQGDGLKKKSYYELRYSLHAIAKRRLGIDIDKTVRGKIVNEGLTEEVVIYAAGDVVWLEDIMDSQFKDFEEQNLTRAATFECEFVKGLAYTKYCGVHLDVNKWKDKMKSDQDKLETSTKALNDYVENLGECITKEANTINDALKLEEIGYTHTTGTTYKYKILGVFTKIEKQGSLFDGFNINPSCIINWSSSKQVIKLFEVLGINVNTFDSKTKKKTKSVNSKILITQADKFPIIQLFNNYQESAKVVSTYGQNWLNAINPCTKRIHAELHSIGTDTGK